MGKPAKTAKKNGVTIYPFYRHTGQDPMVGALLDATDRLTNESQGKTAKKAHVNPATVKNWRSKKTRRPQHATMAAYAGAVGLRFKLVRTRT